MKDGCCPKKRNQDECATDRMTMFDSRKGVMIEQGCLAQSKDNKTSTCQRESSDKNFTHPDLAEELDKRSVFPFQIGAIIVK